MSLLALTCELPPGQVLAGGMSGSQRPTCFISVILYPPGKGTTETPSRISEGAFSKASPTPEISDLVFISQSDKCCLIVEARGSLIAGELEHLCGCVIISARNLSVAAD